MSLDDVPHGQPVLGLEEARRALDSEDFDTCLKACRAALEEPAADGAAWAALRDEALDRVRARAEQSPGSAGARWLGLLVRHDPRAAQSVHLGWQQAGAGPTSEPAASEGAAPRTQRGGSSLHFEPCLVGPAHGFTLTVDEAGEFQCVVADELTFGTDLGSDRPPARLHAVPALRGGRSWRVEPGLVDVTVDGDLVGEQGATVRAGQRVAVAADVGGGPTCFRLRTTSRSESLRLDFERGLERDRSVSVLLVAAGRKGRLRIGGRRSFLVHTPGLDGSLELWVEGDRLLLRGSDPVLVAASSDAVRQRSLEPGSAIEFALPMVERVDVQVRRDQPGSAPFWMRIAGREGGVARP